MTDHPLANGQLQALLPALCAVCVGLANEVQAVQLWDPDGNRLTWRRSNGTVRYEPTIQEVLDHAWKGGSVSHPASGTLPMTAATQVGGTYACGMHVAVLLDAEIARRFGYGRR